MEDGGKKDRCSALAFACMPCRADRMLSCMGRQSAVRCLAGSWGYDLSRSES